MIYSVAAPYDKGKIFSDFDKCRDFIIYKVDGNCVFESDIMGVVKYDDISDFANACLRFLLKNNIRVVICDKISVEMKRNLEKLGIRVYDGLSGSTGKALNLLINQMY